MIERFVDDKKVAHSQFPLRVTSRRYIWSSSKTFNKLDWSQRKFFVASLREDLSFSVHLWNTKKTRNFNGFFHFKSPRTWQFTRSANTTTKMLKVHFKILHHKFHLKLFLILTKQASNRVFYQWPSIPWPKQFKIPSHCKCTSRNAPHCCRKGQSDCLFLKKKKKLKFSQNFKESKGFDKFSRLLTLLNISVWLNDWNCDRIRWLDALSCRTRKIFRFGSEKKNILRFERIPNRVKSCLNRLQIT